MLPGLQPPGELGGIRYGIPYYGGVAVVVYNKGQFKDAGVEVPARSTSSPPLPRSCRRPTPTTPSTRRSTSRASTGTAPCPSSGTPAASSPTQDGDTWTGHPGLRGVGRGPDHPQGPGRVVLQGAASTATRRKNLEAFKTGDVGMMIDSWWAPGGPEHRRPEGRRRRLRPAGDRAGSTSPVFIGGSDLAVPARSARRSLAVQWIEILTGLEVQTELAGAGVIPNQEGAFVGHQGNPFLAVADAAATNSRFTPVSPYWVNVVVSQVLEDMLERIFSESATVEEATTEASEQITTIMNRLITPSGADGARRGGHGIGSIACRTPTPPAGSPPGRRRRLRGRRLDLHEGRRDRAGRQPSWPPRSTPRPPSPTCSRAWTRAVAGLGVGRVPDPRIVVCSSAGGGLRLAVVGHERVISAEAGRRVALSAGARVVAVSPGCSTPRGSRAWRRRAPMSCSSWAGPTAGTPRSCCTTPGSWAAPGLRVPVVLAGNADAAGEATALLGVRGRVVLPTDNVIPRIGVLHPGPARRAIREVFIAHVIGGKGLSRGPRFAGLVVCATPDAVLAGIEVVAEVLAGSARGQWGRDGTGHRRGHDRRLQRASPPTTRRPMRPSRRSGTAGRSRATWGCAGVPRTSSRPRWSSACWSLTGGGVGPAEVLAAAAELRRADVGFLPGTAARDGRRARAGAAGGRDRGPPARPPRCRGVARPDPCRAC